MTNVVHFAPAMPPVDMPDTWSIVNPPDPTVAALMDLDTAPFSKFPREAAA